VPAAPAPLHLADLPSVRPVSLARRTVSDPVPRRLCLLPRPLASHRPASRTYGMPGPAWAVVRTYVRTRAVRVRVPRHVVYRAVHAYAYGGVRACLGVSDRVSRVGATAAHSGEGQRAYVCFVTSAAYVCYVLSRPVVAQERRTSRPVAYVRTYAVIDGAWMSSRIVRSFGHGHGRCLLRLTGRDRWVVVVLDRVGQSTYLWALAGSVTCLLLFSLAHTSLHGQFCSDTLSC
jgi:hypothetical protein